MGEPGGLPSMESHRAGHDWSDLAAAAAAVMVEIVQSEMPTRDSTGIEEREFGCKNITQNKWITINFLSWSWCDHHRSKYKVEGLNIWFPND